jgi:hypothetical protein
MDGMRWDDLTTEERLLAEQAVLNLRELNRVCDAAADGTVLNVSETLAMQQGRERIRQMVETTLHHVASAGRVGRKKTADWRPLARPSRQPHGRPVLPDVHPPMEQLLGIPLNAALPKSAPAPLQRSSNRAG